MWFISFSAKTSTTSWGDRGNPFDSCLINLSREFERLLRRGGGGGGGGGGFNILHKHVSSVKRARPHARTHARIANAWAPPMFNGGGVLLL